MAKGELKGPGHAYILIFWTFGGHNLSESPSNQRQTQRDGVRASNAPNSETAEDKIRIRQRTKKVAIDYRQIYELFK